MILNGEVTKMIRIGHGYDVHRLVCGRRLILGGVDIKHEYGLLGHSDADVLVHAVMDALLGAAALGDIGKHFPDSDRKYLDANSLTLAAEVEKLLRAKKYKIVNVDATLIAEKPKLSGYIPQMKKNLAAALKTDEEAINIKATTEEGLGFSGNCEGIAAHAVCLIETI